MLLVTASDHCSGNISAGFMPQIKYVLSPCVFKKKNPPVSQDNLLLLS